MKIEKKRVENTRALRLNSKFRQNRIQYWKNTNKMRKEKNKHTIAFDPLANHFEKALGETNARIENAEYDEACKSAVKNEYQKIVDKIGDMKVSQKEVRDIIKKLKNNKAMGPLGVTNEMYKYGTDERVDYIVASIIELTINYNIMPENLNMGRLMAILKDPSGSPDSTDNIRPITVSDTISVIFEKYYLKIFESIDLDENQFGFRKNASCSHAIFTLKTAQQALVEEKKMGYAVFYDFSKAFDRINRTKMMFNLIGKLNQFLWRALLNYYEVSVVIVVDENDNKKVRKIRVRIGVKQGGPLSPRLFTGHINKILKAIKISGHVMKIGEIQVGLMVYADDTATVRKTTDQVKLTIKIIENYCLVEDIKLNGKKCVWMKLGEKPIRHPISKKLCPRAMEQNEDFQVDNQALKKVCTFRYLGYLITSDGKQTEHYSMRKQAANLAKRELDKINLKNSLLDPKIKGLMIQTLVRSRLVYGLDNCFMNEDTIDKLEQFENNITKEYVGVARRSYSMPILESIKVMPLRDAFAIRKYSLLLQLVSNPLTTKLALSEVEHSCYTLITACGYTNRGHGKSCHVWRVSHKENEDEKLN
jgi:hypothetical protein